MEIKIKMKEIKKEKIEEKGKKMERLKESAKVKERCMLPKKSVWPLKRRELLYRRSCIKRYRNKEAFTSWATVNIFWKASFGSMLIIYQKWTSSKSHQRGKEFIILRIETSSKCNYYTSKMKEMSSWEKWLLLYQSVNESSEQWSTIIINSSNSTNYKSNKR